MSPDYMPDHLSNNSELLSQLKSIRCTHGCWTAHNIEISPGLFTISEDVPDRSSERAFVYLQLIKLFSNRKLEDCRILDLGCLEGGIGIRLAQKGASVVGVDVREGHLIKAKFSSDALGLQDRIKWVKSDITENDFWFQAGSFDIIVCSGLLYHMDAADLPILFERIFNSCSKDALLIIDTNISPTPRQSVQLTSGQIVCGSFWEEHPKGLSLVQRLSKGWSSFRNDRAFWLTERSLTNLVIRSGFTAFVKPLYPYHEWNHINRDIWLALATDKIDKVHPLRSDPDLRTVLDP